MQWSSATPGLLICLLDQSGSMLCPFNNNTSRTVFASRAINRMIKETIMKNMKGTEVKNRCYITVIGYGFDVQILCEGWLSDLNRSPLRIDNVRKKVEDGAGGLVEVDFKMPIWVEPIKEDACTNMKKAFETARDLAKSWISDNPTYPAPVIINISDGVPYYEGKGSNECMSETETIANEIMSLENKDGHVLMFNAEIGNEGHKIAYPNTITQMEYAGNQAKFLFRVSSEIPEGFKAAAEKNGFSVVDGTRGCIFNADAEDLIKFINFGTTKGQADIKQI